MNELPFYIVYKNPLDYPGKYVVRIHRLRGGGLVADEEPYMVEDTYAPIDQRMTSRGLVKFLRSDGDPMSVKETWL